MRIEVSELLDEGARQMTEVTEDIFAVGDSPKLVVSNEVGDVTVASGAEGQISVQGDLEHADRLDYSVRQERGTIYVEAKRKKVGLLRKVVGPQARADISATVPHKTVVKLETVFGDVEVREVEGSCELSTINGKVLIEAARGDFKASTVNGTVNMEDVEGSFEASTVNGGIAFSGQMTPGSRNTFATVNGEVRVNLEGNTRVQVTASAVNGSFSSEPRAAGGGPEDGRKADLAVSTVSGSITVE